jgi:hypothetical protein
MPGNRGILDLKRILGMGSIFGTGRIVKFWAMKPKPLNDRRD